MNKDKQNLENLLNGADYEVVGYHTHQTSFIDDYLVYNCSTEPNNDKDAKLIAIMTKAHKEALQRVYNNPDMNIDTQSAVEITVGDNPASLYLINNGDTCAVTYAVNLDDNNNFYDLSM